MRALLSVSDRSGLVDFARGLVRLGFEIVSTGGTASHLTDAGLPVTPVSAATGFPEVFGGRVKTLHPAIFGAILFNRGVESDRREAAENGISPLDLVAVNLYPFEETLQKDQDVPFETLIETIDIGGPSLLRAAAKNHEHVIPLCDPADYPAVLSELQKGSVSRETRGRLAAKAFRRTAAYDATIARWLTAREEPDPFPERLPIPLERRTLLRYGENPHQGGALYLDPGAAPPALSRHAFVQGKELSYNNLLDADAALCVSRAVGPGTLTIVKHRIPSGVGTAARPAEAFEKAWASDPVAGYGGVVAFTGLLDADGARALTSRFLEVVVVHGVADEARPILAGKRNLRVLTVTPETGLRRRMEMRGIDGGLLVQEADILPDDESGWTVVSDRPPTSAERRALSFAWRVVRGVISNAVVVAGDDATYGVGGGHTSRVDASRDAVAKAGERARGAVAASDAFFPFPDGLEVLGAAGVAAVVQPGGSVRDAEVIAAANRAGIAMVFSGRRHFRH